MILIAFGTSRFELFVERQFGQRLTYGFGLDLVVSLLVVSLLVVSLLGFEFVACVVCHGFSALGV